METNNKPTAEDHKTIHDVFNEVKKEFFTKFPNAPKNKKVKSTNDDTNIDFKKPPFYLAYKN